MLGLDHTLITPRASVGVIGQKRPTLSTWNQLLTTGSDWSGWGRNGFDSRYTLVGAEHPPDLIARVWTRRSPTFQKTWHGFRIREHQDLRRPQNTPIQMPTQMWVCHTWSASRKRRLDFTTRQSFSKGLAFQTVHSHPVVRATAQLPGKHAARLPHSKTVTMTF
jgi:hypothetical protein